MDVPERVGEAIERLSLRTPTLPPATETNSYLVGGDGGFYLVEPATPYGPERRALFECVRRRAARGDTLLGALLTHHHVDHVGAANAFREEFGVPIVAHAITRTKLEGRVAVDRVLGEGDTLLDGAVVAMHTPGHAPGHLCFWHPGARWLIAGDMVASVGTIIVDPDDDGDMQAYVRELARLATLPIARMLPAHGDPIDDAHARLAFYLAHRRAREAKVLAAVAPDGVDLATLVRTAYDDTPAFLWPLAAKSARAHLEKLAREGAVRVERGRWLPA